MRETGYYWVIPWNGKRWQIRFYEDTHKLNGINGRWLHGFEVTESINEDKLFTEINETRIKNPYEIK